MADRNIVCRSKKMIFFNQFKGFFYRLFRVFSKNADLPVFLPLIRFWNQPITYLCVSTSKNIYPKRHVCLLFNLFLYVGTLLKSFFLINLSFWLLFAMLKVAFIYDGVKPKAVVRICWTCYNWYVQCLFIGFCQYKGRLALTKITYMTMKSVKS